MLFLTYWELNENMSSQERLDIAGKLMAGGLFPPKGVKVLRWDETPDAWGILLFEADSESSAFTALSIWRAAGAGFFKMTKTAPVVPIGEPLIQAELAQLEALGKA